MSTAVGWLHGCATALVTPFEAGGAVDLPRMRALVERNDSLIAEVYAKERVVNAMQIEVDELAEVVEELAGLGFGEVGGFELVGEGVGGEDGFAEGEGGFLFAFGVVALGPDLEGGGVEGLAELGGTHADLVTVARVALTDFAAPAR